MENTNVRPCTKEEAAQADSLVDWKSMYESIISKNAELRRWMDDIVSALLGKSGQFAYTPQTVSAEVAALRDRCNKLDVENDELRRVLRQVEWAGRWSTQVDAILFPVCPSCYRAKKHAPDCHLATALGGTEGGKP